MVFAGDFGRFFALGGGLGGGRVLARFESWRRLGSLAFSPGILAVLWALFGRRRRNFGRLLARRRRAFFFGKLLARRRRDFFLKFVFHSKIDSISLEEINPTPWI